MRFRAASVVGVLVLSACTSGGPPPAKSAPQVVTRPRVEIKIEGLEPELQPERVADARCEDLTALASAGDYKPVIDLAGVLDAEGLVCPEEAAVAVEASRRLLESADDLIRQSTAKKRVGDYHAAKEDLQAALEIYPKYYWVSKLLRDLGESRPEPTAAPSVETGVELARVADAGAEAEIELLRRLLVEQNLEFARLAELQGDLASARRWTLQAMKAEPGDADVREGLVEHARLLGLKFFSAGELTPAREIWTQALSLDHDDRRLNEYLRQVAERLESLEEIRRGD